MIEKVKAIAKKDMKQRLRYGEEGTKIGENEYITEQRHPFTGLKR